MYVKVLSPTCFLWLAFLLSFPLVNSQGQLCYYGPGAEHRAPSEVVPCTNDGNSACCLQGDICLSGNACYNYEHGTTYQYGCTDRAYQDETCPFKCGFDASLSPWVGLQTCDNIQGVTNTWVCHAPENCGCQWNSSWGMVDLTPRGCKEMGSEARVALHAPPVLIPYVLLPTTPGGSTGHWSLTTIFGTTTWSDAPLTGYTPASVGPFVTYRDMPTKIERVRPNATPSPSTAGPIGLTSTTNTTPDSSPTPVSSTSPAYTGTTASPASPSSTPSLLSTSPSSTSSTSASPPSLTSLTSSTPTASHTTSSLSGLSTGTKVGIGLGIAAAGISGLAALLIAILQVRRRRHRAAAVDDPTQQSRLSMRDSSNLNKSPWPQQQAQQTSPNPQSESGGYHEAPTSAGRVELSSQPGIFELSTIAETVEAASPLPAYSEMGHPGEQRKTQEC